MSRTWEEIFQIWARPPSESEQKKCENAENAVRRAIEGSKTLKGKSIRIFAQGSYSNRTNVKEDSDVDICVLCTDLIIPDYSMSDGLTDADVDLADQHYSYKEFKDDTENALRAYFGDDAVVRGNKAVEIHESTTRVDSDVVPCFEHRRYYRMPDGSIDWHSGTQFIADDGAAIINWPDQHYENGVSKNDNTNKAFKSVVRILKNARNEMLDKGLIPKELMPSFLLECLIWNTPNNHFNYSTWIAITRSVLAKLFNDTIKKENCWNYEEASRLKWLFRGEHKWTYQGAHDFLGKTWEFLGYE